jgi:DNA-binding MarR family transcriptional regulator
MDRPDVPEALRRLLARTHDVEEALARRLHLGDTDVVALQHLVDHPDAGPADLARLLHIRTASATALVDRLQDAGHVRRAPHPTDGRRVVLALTGSARAEVRAVLAPLIDGIADVVAGFGEDERQAIARFLVEATGALAAFAEVPPSSQD